MNRNAFSRLIVSVLFGCMCFHGSCQGFTSKEATFFRVGDSIRVDAEFVFGKIVRDSLGQPASTDLIWLNQFLVEHPLMEVSICVHTDTRGSYDKNLERSQKRAESIGAWLSQVGVDRTRFTIAGCGEAQPIIPESIIDAHIRTNREAYDSLHNVNDRITVQITEVQQVVTCDYRPADDPSLWKYYREASTVFRVNDRFRLDFIPVHESPMVTTSSQKAYEELVAFIRCNPSVVFAVSVHCANGDNHFEERFQTKQQAVQIIALLTGEFGLSQDQFLAIGAGSDQPIIPDVVMEEFSKDPVQRAKYDQLNTRVELVIAEIGAGK